MDFLLLTILVMVHGVDKHSTKQDIDFVCVVFDTDTVGISDTPFLTDGADFFISEEDFEIPSQSITGNLVVIVSRNIDADFFLGHWIPNLLLARRPELAVLVTFKLFLRRQRVVRLCQIGQLLPVRGLERSLIADLHTVSNDFVNRLAGALDGIVVGHYGQEVLFEVELFHDREVNEWDWAFVVATG